MYENVRPRQSEREKERDRERDIQTDKEKKETDEIHY